MLNNEGWTDGDWGSNTAINTYDFGTPTSLVLNGGAGNGWTDDLPGYQAAFTKSITTGLSDGSDKVIITGNNGRIEAQFAGAATVELYSLTGQLLVKEVVENQFSMNVNQGGYMVRINGNTQKVIVR